VQGQADDPGRVEHQLCHLLSPAGGLEQQATPHPSRPIHTLIYSFFKASCSEIGKKTYCLHRKVPNSFFLNFMLDIRVHLLISSHGSDFD
jgi:hypothetical protein